MSSINLNSLDKSNWKSYKFEEIAFKISKTVKPQEADVDIYVGLEHLDGEDLHIRRKGVPSDVKGGKLRCHQGDVIFGKRRAYQRKAAVVDFEGICSAHAFVFRANTEVIHPDLFPFFLHSDQFMHRMIDISVGGLSPTINWGDLKHQEFLLPPKDQQARLAELLWGMDEVIEKSIELLKASFIQLQVSNNHFLLEGFNNKTTFSKKLKRQVSIDSQVLSVEELINSNFLKKVQDGNHGEIHPKSKDYVSEGIPFIMANTLIKGKVDLSKAKKLPQRITDRLRIGFSIPNDVLLSHKGTIGQTAVVPNDLDCPYVMLTPQVTLYRTAEKKLLHKFLFYSMSSSYFQNQLLNLSSQSTRAYIGITSQLNLNLVIPNTIEKQKLAVEFLDDLSNNKSLVDKAIDSSKALQKSLINQIFG